MDSSFLSSSLGSEFYQNCFFVYDDCHTDEMAKDEDLILFFHPPNVDIYKRLQLMGACDSMITFTTTFTKSPIRVIEMHKVKLTYRIIDKFAVVLTSGPDCSRHSLESMLDILLQAFRFYHHSFAELERLSDGNRKLFQENMTRACSLLMPMLNQFHASLANQFHPMPYLELSKIQPKVGSTAVTRFFVQASRILTQLEMVDRTMACCIVHADGSILCTHLDLDTTRWIVNRISTLETQGGPGPETFSEDCFVDSDTVAKLRADRAKSVAGIHIALSPDRSKAKSRQPTPAASPATTPAHSSSSSQASTPRAVPPLGTPIMSQQHQRSPNASDSVTPASTPSRKRTGSTPGQSNPGSPSAVPPAPRIYEKMALIIVRIGSLFLATLADAAALTGTNDYVGKMNKMILQPVSELDAVLSKAISDCDLVGTGSPGQSGPPSPSSTAIPPPIGATSSPIPIGITVPGSPSSLAPPSAARASGTKPGTTLSRLAGATSPRHLSSTRISSPRADAHQSSPAVRSAAANVVYNYLTFNHATQSQSGAVQMKKPAEAERNFLRIVSHAHDVFYENPQVTKLIMKDAATNIFCRSIFGRETYYQQANSIPFKNVEDAARDNLASGDDGLTLI